MQVKTMLCLAVLLAGAYHSNAQISVSEAGDLPDSSAILDVQATDKGMLIPRMDSIAREQIHAPATGLIVYQTDGKDGFYFYNGSLWVALSSLNAPGHLISDADGDTGIDVESSPDIDLIQFTTGGIDALTIDTSSNVGMGISTPDGSAIMDVTASDQGFLPPRMTKAERDAIVNPAAGLIIYCTNCLEGRLQTYDGSEWATSEKGAVWGPVGDAIVGQATGDRSGVVSMSADGKIVAVGAPFHDGLAGHVRVYQWDGAAWSQLGDDIDGEASGDRSGGAVAISDNGELLAIGAARNNSGGMERGHVRVYERVGDSNQWTQRGSDIDGDLTGGRFGESVAFSSDGSILAIGAPRSTVITSSEGLVEVFAWDEGSGDWIQLGSDINGEEVGDFFGTTVALSSDGTILAVGAETTLSSGFSVLYEWTGSNWEQLGSEIPGVDFSGAGRAIDLSADGSIVAIGAPQFFVNPSRGYVRVYRWNQDSSDWVQQGDVIIGEDEGDASGTSVALSSDGTILAVGAPFNNSGATDAGYVRVFQWQGDTWVLIMGPYDGTFSNENAGTFVAMSSDGAIIAVGAPGFSSERGRVQVISTKPGVQWASLTDVPSVFQDGVDDIGSWSTLEGIPSGFADNVDNVDNMGNHTATMDLDMNRHDIRNVKSLVITGSQGVNNSGTGTQMYKQLEITYPEFNSFIFNDYKWFIGHQFATPSPVDDDLYFYVERGSTFDPAANVAGFVQDNENGPQMNFTGQHRCLVLDVDYNEAGLDARYSGLIVVAEHDEYLGMSAGLQKGHDAILINEALPIVALSSKQQDKRVFGVISHLEGPEREDAVGAFVTPFPKESGDQRFYINSVGEGGIWIIDEGGNLESGDYIQSSSVPGYGMRQKDQSMHNYTVAKITRACDFSPEEKPQQKIRRMAASEHDGSPAKNATDEFGRIIWETDYDINGETKVQSEYKVRYVKHDGTQITFDEYVQLKLEGVKVYRAAFIGCTYHCG